MLKGSVQSGPSLPAHPFKKKKKLAWFPEQRRLVSFELRAHAQNVCLTVEAYVVKGRM